MFCQRYFPTQNVNGMEKHAQKKKNHSTSIENHGVVQKQLSVRFEFFVTSVLSFIHLLQRATESSITQTGLEHGDTAELSRTL